MQKSRIRISMANLNKVKEFAAAGSKIKAIKFARANGRAFPGKKQEPLADGTVEINHSPGLRESKHAVEVLMGQLTTSESSCVFTQELHIKKIIVAGSTGDVELDVDELQLRCLDGLSQGLPISEIGAMTNLITFIRKWQGQNEEGENE